MQDDINQNIYKKRHPVQCRATRTVIFTWAGGGGANQEHFISYFLCLLLQLCLFRMLSDSSAKTTSSSSPSTPLRVTFLFSYFFLFFFLSFFLSFLSLSFYTFFFLFTSFFQVLFIFLALDIHRIVLSPRPDRVTNLIFVYLSL